MRPEAVWGTWAVDSVVPGGPPGRLFLDDHCPNCDDQWPVWVLVLVAERNPHMRLAPPHTKFPP